VDDEKAHDNFVIAFLTVFGLGLVFCLGAKLYRVKWSY